MSDKEKPENADDQNESPKSGFTEGQKNYLQGFALGSDVARVVRGLPVISDSAVSYTHLTLPTILLV